ncbi:MAG: hypothetical protein V3U93_05525 [Alphaproteobacteria bacterium]
MVALVAAGCGLFGTKVAQHPCPRAGVLKEAAALTKFRPGPGRDLTDVLFEARFTNVQTTCKYDSKGVKVDMRLALAVERGPADRSRKAEFEYFVAIADPSDAVLAKERFATRMSYPPNLNRVSGVEELEQMIPLQAGRSAAAYKIIVGFQLTKGELEFNQRRRKR